MASRRDELNAYTFARKRMVGAFLQPSGGGSDEDAPRPIRAVVPSLVVGALAMAGFGLWGMIKPSAPVGWDSGKNVIVGKDSTTRYVILQDQSGNKILHPVVNMASAKLVLPADSQVVFVADSVLDHYKSHGATIGIPFAPDKLPSAADAQKPKVWSVCDRPGTDAAHPNQSVFVAADADAAKLANKSDVLGGGDALLVQGPSQNGVPGTQYLVGPQGTAFPLGSKPGQDVGALRSALFGSDPQPEQVTQEWLNTLKPGPAIDFPGVPGLDPSGQRQVRSNVQLSDPNQDYVGRLLITQDKVAFVVGKDQLYRLTPLVAQLVDRNPITQAAYGTAVPGFAPLTPSDFDKYGQQPGSLTGVDPNWPVLAPPGSQLNGGAPGTARSVVCSTFQGTYNGNDPVRTVWAGTDYPANVTTGSATAHVSPGHGLFYRAMDNGTQSSGSTFLVTETGLRYSVPANNDGTANGPTAGGSPSPSPSAGGAAGQQSQPPVNEAQARLGYKDDTPVPVPKAWSDLLPAGPALNTVTATQEQNS